MSWQGIAWLTAVLNFFKTVWYSFAGYVRRKLLRDRKREETAKDTADIIEGGDASDMLNQFEELDRLKDK